MNLYAQQIGEAWRLHRASDNQNSIKLFEQVISSLSTDVSESREQVTNLIDAHYGLGLSQRALGNSSQAGDAFRKALNISRENLAALRVNTENRNNLDTDEDDRYAMLITMITQRMVEIGLQE